MVSGQTQGKYITYLGWALGISDVALQRVLWSPPRCLMLEFLPTLDRLLTTQWREHGVKWAELTSNRSPLPQFIPDALFSKLNLPALGIALQRGKDSITLWESLDFFQGLREFAPGRISKRYATDSNYDADWLVPADFQPAVDEVMRVPFDIAEAFGQRKAFEGEVEVIDGETMKIFSPLEIYTQNLPKQLNLAEKSNAFLEWHAYFNNTNVETITYDPPLGSWRKSLLDVTFFSHGQMTPLEIIRYTTGSFASLRFKSGGGAHIHFEFQDNGHPVGVGVKQWVDGVKLRFKISKDVLMEILTEPLIIRALRPVYFHYCVSQLKFFENDPFTANRVTECFLAALAQELEVNTCARRGNPAENIKAGLTSLLTADGIEKLQAIPFSLFQPDERQTGEEQTLHECLSQYFSNQEFLEQIHNCAKALWQELYTLSGFDTWLRTVLANTMAGAGQQLIYILFPDVNEREVVTDAIWKNDVLEIWLTETEGGGSGIIDRLSQIYYEDPVHFLSILVRCLQPGVYEQIDSDLYGLLETLEHDVQLRRVVTTARIACDHKERRQATEDLHTVLKEEGFALSHSFISVLFSRVIRPGSSNKTDSKLLNLLRKWRHLEMISGLEWNLNIAAHTLACQSFAETVEPEQLFSKFCLYQGLLWPRGNSIRQSELGYYSPFHAGPTLTERLLGAALFDDNTPQVVYQPETWLSSLHTAIYQAGRVDLIIERQNYHEISAVISRLQSEAIEHLGLLLYPRVIGLRRVSGQILLRIEMAEMLQ